jgi:hypothetical protein
MHYITLHANGLSGTDALGLPCTSVVMLQQKLLRLECETRDPPSVYSLSYIAKVWERDETSSRY